MRDGSITLDILDTEDEVIQSLKVHGETHNSFSTVVDQSGNYRVCMSVNKSIFKREPDKTFEMSVTFLAFDHSEEAKSLTETGKTNFLSMRSVDKVGDRLQTSKQKLKLSFKIKSFNKKSRRITKKNMRDSQATCLVCYFANYTLHWAQ